MSARLRPAHADDLAEVQAEAFRLLARGVADRRSAFHTPTLATIGRDGAPRARTLVLRGFDAPTRTLRLHTDARSHVYDAGQQVQLRLDCVAQVHREDALAEAAWDASRPFSRMCYAIEPAPGTPLDAPPEAPRDSEAGRPHFAVLALRFDRLEWLWLAAEGHRRARLAWTPDGTPEATWLSP
ncbi:MAG: hypothetical protein MUC64_16860 [Rubritepida sp.]|nr:hypothetical protein [Rubritepida sp.]